MEIEQHVVFFGYILNQEHSKLRKNVRVRQRFHLLKMHQLWRTIVQHSSPKKMEEKRSKNEIEGQNFLKIMVGETVKRLE